MTALTFSFASLAQQPVNDTLASSPAQAAAPELAGEFLDVEVPYQNYAFVRNTVTVFGNKWGPVPKTDEERENLAWEQLLLSYESFRRNITVSQEEVDTEIANVLAEQKAAFDHKANRDAFEKWTLEKAGEPAELFENQIRHLLQIEKLRQQVIESIAPQVEGKEALEEFLNEYNSLSVTIAQFDSDKEAQGFYQKVKRKPKLWQEEEGRNPDIFRSPGFVTLQFLMDIWRFPKEAVYKMLKMKKGEFYPPAPIYKGYAVFRINETRIANKKEFAKEKIRERYFEKIKRRKQYEGYNQWLKNFKEQAKIKIYSEKGGKGQ